MSNIQSSIDSVVRTAAAATLYAKHAKGQKQEEEKKKKEAVKKEKDAHKNNQLTQIVENMEWLRQNAITRADMLKKNRETATAQAVQRKSKHKFDADVVGGMTNEFNND